MLLCWAKNRENNSMIKQEMKIKKLDEQNWSMTGID